jgi:hypothetical protein
MWVPQKLRQMIGLQIRSTQYLAEIAAGSDNQQRIINDKLNELIGVLSDISDVQRTRLDALVAGSDHQQKLINAKLDAVIAMLDNQSKPAG